MTRRFQSRQPWRGPAVVALLAAMIAGSLPRLRLLSLVSYPAPDPEIVAPVPILPDLPAQRSRSAPRDPGRDRIPLALWWEKIRGDHLSLVRITGEVRGPLARLQVEAHYRRPLGLVPGEGQEFREELQTVPWSWIQELSVVEPSGERALETPESPWTVASGGLPQVEWTRPGRFLLRLPAPGESFPSSVRFTLGMVLTSEEDGWTSLPLSVSRLPMARMEVEVSLQEQGPVVAWELPSGFQVSPRSPGVIQIRGSRERTQLPGGLRLRWQGTVPSRSVSFPSDADRLEVPVQSLGGTLGLAQIQGAWIGEVEFPVQVLLEGEARDRQISLLRWDSQLRPRAPLEVTLRPGEGSTEDLPEAWILGLTRSARALSGPAPAGLSPGKFPRLRTRLLLPWPQREPFPRACAQVREELHSALESFHRQSGTRLPASWSGTPRRWRRLEIPSLLSPESPGEVLAVHARDFARGLPQKPSEWLRFSFLVPELAGAGLLRDRPRDPGFSSESLDHYLLLGSGEVFCRFHDAKILADRGIPREILIPFP